MTEGLPHYTPRGIARAALAECDRYEAMRIHTINMSTASLRELAEWALALSDSARDDQGGPTPAPAGRARSARC